MKSKFTVSICAILACILYACSTDETDEKLAEEEKKLAEYITTTFPDAISLGGGAYVVKTVEKEDSATIEAGNYILWNWKQTNQITEELEYTSDLHDIKFQDSYVHGGPEISLVLLSYKIDEGLMQMKKGEKSDIYIPSRWLFYDFQPRKFSVEIVDVVRDLSVYQENLMSGYLNNTYKGISVDTIKNVVSAVDNTKYNVMYHIVNEGTGEAVKQNVEISTKTDVSYLIQENEVHPYIPATEPSWRTSVGERINTLTKSNCMGEILKKMKKGGKVVVTMPSKLYWEDKNLPINGAGQYYIPKWSVVVFTITIQ